MRVKLQPLREVIERRTGVWEGPLDAPEDREEARASTTVYDLVRTTTYRARPGEPLTIPRPAS